MVCQVFRKVDSVDLASPANQTFWQSLLAGTKVANTEKPPWADASKSICNKTLHSMTEKSHLYAQSSHKYIFCHPLAGKCKLIILIPFPSSLAQAQDSAVGDPAIWFWEWIWFWDQPIRGQPGTGHALQVGRNIDNLCVGFEIWENQTITVSVTWHN